MAGVYIHIPFCETKCPYCDFIAGPDMGVSARRYCDALVREVELACGAGGSPAHPAVSTVFFGGGTPSLMDATDIARMLTAVHAYATVDADAEVTLEANPGDVSPERLAGYAEAGVTRVSLGFQSPRDAVLQLLGRRHTAAEGFAAAEAVASAGFVSWSIDLIYATPGQTVVNWVEDVDRALALGPPHISAYALTLGGSKRLTTDRPAVTDDVQADMFLAGHDRLTAAGYEHYEISNYARPGHACRHNLVYWSGAPYRGFGVGAHSYAPAAPPFAALSTDPGGWGAGGRRFWNAPSAENYCARVEAGALPIAGEEALTEDEAVVEALGIGLRLAEGISVATAPPLPRDVVASLADAGLLDARALARGRLALTPRGWLVTDEIAGRLAAAAAPRRLDRTPVAVERARNRLQQSDGDV